MKLGECKMGMLVGIINKNVGPSFGGIMDVGFITGLATNYCNEVVVKLTCADGTETSVHPGNLEPIEPDVVSMFRKKRCERPGYEYYETNFTLVKS